MPQLFLRRLRWTMEHERRRHLIKLHTDPCLSRDSWLVERLLLCAPLSRTAPKILRDDLYFLVMGGKFNYQVDGNEWVKLVDRLEARGW